MSTLLLLTSTTQPSAEVLPALALLPHQVKILAAEGSALLEAPEVDLVLVDGRKELAHARDRHCAFPGCRRPPIACDAHHIEHWANGGPTALRNMVLLCRAHHTVLHNTPWEVRINPADRRPEFKPPPGRHRLHPDFRERLDTADDWVRERTPRA